MNKAQKVQFVIETLQKTYPKIPIPLDHKDPYTLLIAVLLSAQSVINYHHAADPQLDHCLLAADPFAAASSHPVVAPPTASSSAAASLAAIPLAAASSAAAAPLELSLVPLCHSLTPLLAQLLSHKQLGSVSELGFASELRSPLPMSASTLS